MFINSKLIPGILTPRVSCAMLCFLTFCRVGLFRIHSLAADVRLSGGFGVFHVGYGVMSDGVKCFVQAEWQQADGGVTGLLCSEGEGLEKYDMFLKAYPKGLVMSFLRE